MDVIINTSLDPYFNLASEEFLLENGAEDIFMLWRNSRAVVIGKNQNACAETNAEFLAENNIALVRRLSGGGAVFHDTGNINFTFITSKSEGGINFARFLAPVCDLLGNFGVKSAPDGRNDIVADGCKISGNAQCVLDAADGRKRLLHHGTLLFSADLTAMSGALCPNREKLRSHGIKSVKSRVANITDLAAYRGTHDVEKFMSLLALDASRRFGKVRTLTQDEKAKISAIRESKYKTWEWNLGYGATFSDEREKHFPFGTVTVGLEAEKGIIRSVKIGGDFFGECDISLLENRLCGVRLERVGLTEVLDGCEKYISGSSPEAIAGLLTD